MNKRTLNQRLLLILIVATSFVSGLKAQDVDSLFKVARDAAFERKDYTTAIQVSKTALDIKPDYTELIIIFLARVYTWSKQYDSARLYFNEALRQQPGSEDAFTGFADMEYWAGSHEAALNVVDNGLKVHPASEGLLLRKARILEARKAYAEAIPVLDSLLRINRKMPKPAD
ncbi:tetratricopeptide repeat protein [Niabella sp. W65]|nr:tetratricopeptide repeat protein [Niabella sp. W65]MCH7362985.1 tetratricopeptide repeat protein [Niabella sp. W65]ULT38921.1 tetratricopeptide repeat protein [Niabella sp. I65]